MWFLNKSDKHAFTTKSDTKSDVQQVDTVSICTVYERKTEAKSSFQCTCVNHCK